MSDCFGRIWILCGFLAVATTVSAQQAQLSGFVKDPAGSAVRGATASILNVATSWRQSTASNDAGRFTLPLVRPGVYRLTVEASGFEKAVVEDLRIDVGSKIERDVTLQLGSVSQSVTVDGSGIAVNTTDASVSTIVDRKFVENIPLNGRSFQSLLTLVPGVSLVPSQGIGYSGQLSVNGQRTEANYFTVDGVSANSATISGQQLGNGVGFSGSVASQTALGTTQSLVSVDALQEFRAATSTYSAEYGRSPGGQFLFTTRSGSNDWHGSAFDYFRNDALDATNWFDSANGGAKQAERQNDFGGTLGGPVFIPRIYNGKDKTFFFFSYEGLRLSSPQAAITTEVASLSLRQKAPSVLQPFLNAFPVPNGADLGNGLAYFTAGYSSPSRLDSTSIRIDHAFGDRLKTFGRFSDAPSSTMTRYPWGLSQRDLQELKSKVLTLGATAIISPRVANDLRFNTTWSDSFTTSTLDDFGGARPLSISDLPGLGGGNLTWLYFRLFFGQLPTFGQNPGSSRQRQMNIVDTTTAALGRHNFKFGVDYRRTATATPLPVNYVQAGYFSEAEVLLNNPGILRVFRSPVTMRPVYQNFSAFAQDEWTVSSRLNVSLGVRWELNPAPRDAGGNQPYTIDQITNLATAKVAPAGTALWATTYRNFAPRVGAAYRIHLAPKFETVLRSGAGLFYDTGNTQASQGYLFGIGRTSSKAFSNSPFPLTQQQLDSIPAPNTNAPYLSNVYAFDPNLKLPYTVQWNAALEQQLGGSQTLTVSYVGSAAHRLLSQILYAPGLLGNPNFGQPGTSLGLSSLLLTNNRGSSNYNALQTQFQRRLSHGVQVLGSYTWSHSIDNASSNFTLTQLLRGDSDFDIRHNFQAALTFDVPGKYQSRVASALLKGWAVDGRVFARSATPVNIIGTTGADASTGASLNFQPDRIAGQPLYVTDANAPGGRRINAAAFRALPAGLEGDAGRNSARGFAAVQTDLTLHREFRFAENTGLEFRAEAFNVFNHPNFGSIYNQVGDPLFGLAQNTLGSQLGGLSQLYQVGGPRSLQLALRFHF